MAKIDPEVHKQNLKQMLAYPGSYYGNGGTIHSTTHLDIEVMPDGSVAAVWFRCMMLPFEVHKVTDYDKAPAVDMQNLPKITGIEIARD